MSKAIDFLALWRASLLFLSMTLVYLLFSSTFVSVPFVWAPVWLSCFAGLALLFLPHLDTCASEQWSVLLGMASVMAAAVALLFPYLQRFYYRLTRPLWSVFWLPGTHATEFLCYASITVLASGVYRHFYPQASLLAVGARKVCWSQSLLLAVVFMVACAGTFLYGQLHHLQVLHAAGVALPSVWQLCQLYWQCISPCLTLVAAYSEELLCRLIPYQVLVGQGILDVGVYIVISSAFFMLLHWHTTSILYIPAMLSQFLFGMVAALMTARNQEISLPTALHFAHNVSLASMTVLPSHAGLFVPPGLAASACGLALSLSTLPGKSVKGRQMTKTLLSEEEVIFPVSVNPLEQCSCFALIH